MRHIARRKKLVPRTSKTRQGYQYAHIRAWGRMMGKWGYEIELLQNQAAQEHAPLDVIYKSHKLAPGGERWVRLNDIRNPATLDMVIANLEIGEHA